MRKKFTLIELLVVIAIIAILAAILLPSLNRAKMAARSIDCIGREKQIGAAFSMYGNDYNGFWPAPALSVINGFWFIAIGPYFKYNIAPGLASFPSTDAFSTARKTFFYCPEADFAEDQYSMYGGKVKGYGMNRFISPSDKIPSWSDQMLACPRPAMVSSPSSRILIADTRDQQCLNGYWEFTQSSVLHTFYSFDRQKHKGGANIVYVDGHTGWMSNAEAVSKAQSGNQILFTE